VKGGKAYIALLCRLWKFPSLAKERWRAAPGWFDRGDSTTQIGVLYYTAISNSYFFVMYRDQKYIIDGCKF
jgi:hypothetical protein